MPFDSLANATAVPLLTIDIVVNPFHNRFGRDPTA